MSVSIEARMLQQAQKFLKEREYTKSCDWFDKYFKRVYKEGTPITVEIARSLLSYADALISKNEKDGKPGKYDDEDLESAAEYVLTARETFQNAAEGTYTIEELADTHTMLGRVCTMNNQFKRAVQEFQKAVETSKKSTKDNAWRIVASNMVLLGGGYEYIEKPKKGLEVFQEVLKIINEQYEKENEEGKKDIDGFKETVLERIKDLEGDVKEQEANKEDLKEEDNDEEEEEEEEEGEEEEEEEENGEEEKKETIADNAPVIDAPEIKKEDDATVAKELNEEEKKETTSIDAPKIDKKDEAAVAKKLNEEKKDEEKKE